MDPKVREIEEEYMRSGVPSFSPGDTVRVRVRVTEGDKSRLQAFEGVCIAKSGSGLNETFTVRRISGGVGVERIFPLHSPTVEEIEVVRRGQVRRAKLYYLRGRRGKAARVRERRDWEEGEAQSAAAEEAGAAAGAPEGMAPGETESVEAAGPEQEVPEEALPEGEPEGEASAEAEKDEE